MAEETELAPTPTWECSINGFPIYNDPTQAPGWITIKDAQGNTIATIYGGAKIYLGKRS